MKRKILSILLIVSLSLCLIALAGCGASTTDKKDAGADSTEQVESQDSVANSEATESDQSEPVGSANAETEDYTFTFRNGIVWGASPEEVMTAEGTPDKEPAGAEELEVGHLTSYLCSDYTVAGYDTEMYYEFLDDRLAIIAMILKDYENDAETLENVKSELIAAYGEPNYEDYDFIFGGTLDEETLAQIDKFAWKLPDNRTLILLMMDGKGEVSLVYMDQSVAAALNQSAQVQSNELRYSGTSSAENIESISVSFILSEDKSNIHDFTISVNGFQGTARITGATVSVEVSGQTQTIMKEIPVDYEGDNQDIAVGDSTIESLRFNEDGSADLVFTYCYKETAPQAYENPVSGIQFEMNSESAPESEG